MQCGAKTRSGAPCKAPAMGNGRCRMHGGLTPTGIALPQFKTGRYSKSIPARLAATYGEAQRDPKLLELRDEVSLVDARLHELLQHIDTLGDPASWQQAAAFWHEAKTESDPFRKARAENALDALLERATDQYAAWAGVSQAIEQRRRLVESEHKRLVAMEQMIPAEKAMSLVAALLESIRRHVRDPEQLAGIQADFSRLTAADDHHIVDAN